MKTGFGVLVVILIGTSCCKLASGINVTKKFHLITTYKANWYRALHHCHSNGMRLASISSSEEHDELTKLALDSGYNNIFWLGGTTLGNGQNYYWMGQNKGFSFTSWNEGEPNNHGGIQNCMHLCVCSGVAIWDDQDCLDEQYFVCEEELEQ